MEDFPKLGKKELCTENGLKAKKKKKIDSYEGTELNKIPEEDRELVKIIRGYGYGLGNGLTPFEEVMKFARENGRLPKDRKERTLYKKWLKTEEKKKVDKYVGKKLEEIPEEDRELVETIRGYGYGITPFEEVMKFAGENGRLPKDRKERTLYQKWLISDEKKKVDKYVGKKLEEIPEEDRELVETIRGYGYIPRKKKIVSQQIGQATYLSSTEECDQAQSVLDGVVRNELKKGGITQNDT